MPNFISNAKIHCHFFLRRACCEMKGLTRDLMLTVTQLLYRVILFLFVELLNATGLRRWVVL